MDNKIDTSHFRRKGEIVFAAVLVAFSLFLIFIPTGFQRAIYVNAEGARAKVLATDDSTVIQTGLFRQGDQRCTVEVLSGSHKGLVMDGVNMLSGSLANDKIFRPGEIAWVRELCPQSRFYGDAYHLFGLFGGEGCPTIMAHCVYSGEEEIALMQRQRVFIAHCPASNTNLASGIAPVRRYLTEGIPMGLGSDVAGGTHTSIFRAMADAIQVSKLRWRLQDSTLAPLTAAEAFYLGTLGGGAFFGKVGSFLPRYEFDALVIDDSRYTPQGSRSIPERLERTIYLSDERDLAHKYAAGKQLF